MRADNQSEKRISKTAVSLGAWYLHVIFLKKGGISQAMRLIDTADRPSPLNHHRSEGGFLKSNIFCRFKSSS